MYQTFISKEEVKLIDSLEASIGITNYIYSHYATTPLCMPKVYTIDYLSKVELIVVMLSQHVS